MKPVLMAGMTIVIFALVSYSIGVITEQRRKLVTNLVLTFLTVGVSLDIIATVCMIIGSEAGAFTIHGVLGYSALTAMLIDTILVWRFRRANGPVRRTPRWLHLYSRAAYSWWVFVFISGSLLIAVRKA
ncbi:MAG: hypothetical protein JSW34_13135 [Candidatus Zixiibacteriota bacterium]|nr:MAG: hypothetical protein JSW34_13135 [candidate division Zixibacteria bacterium]